MVKKILIPVDVEEPETLTGILEHLKLIARGTDSEITLMTVVPELGTLIAQAAQAAPFASISPHDWRDQALELAHERLVGLHDKNVAEIGSAQVIVKAGTIYSEVLQTADEMACDLIILMSHIPRIGDYLLGPNAAKIVRHARCSVYVVRPDL